MFDFLLFLNYMRILVLLLAILVVSLSLKLDRSHSMVSAASDAVEQEHLQKIMEHLQSYNPYSSTPSNGYNSQSNNNAQVNSAGLLQIRNQYLAKLPPGPTVDYTKATQMADFLATPMGATMLNYFDSRTVQADGSKGLNYYKLSDRNFRLWMSIKMIANTDTNLYARSLTIDQSLFAQFISKTSQ